MPFDIPQFGLVFQEVVLH